jgi:hypothetical protein
MRHTLRALVLILSVPAISQPAFDTAQLAELQKQQQFAEVLARGLDVPVAARTATWRETVEQAALAELARLRQVKKPGEVMLTVDGWLDRYAHLGSVKALLESRAQVALELHSACLSESESFWCAEQLLVSAKRGGFSGKDLWSAADTARRQDNAHDTGLSLVAAAARLDAVRCGDEWLTDALPAAGRRDEKSVDDLVSACRGRLPKAALTRLLDAEAGLSRHCPVLVASKDFTGVQRSRCERHLSKGGK